MGHIRQLIAVAIENKELPFTFFCFFFSADREPSFMFFFFCLCSPPPAVSFLYYFCLHVVLIYHFFSWLFPRVSSYFAFLPHKQAPSLFSVCRHVFPSGSGHSGWGYYFVYWYVWVFVCCNCAYTSMCFGTAMCVCVCPGGILEGFSHNPPQSAYLDFTFCVITMCKKSPLSFYFVVVFPPLWHYETTFVTGSYLIRVFY